MGDTSSFASLSPGLLARKGGAKPAMRQKVQPLDEFHEDMARQEDDLGWNDMGGNAAEQAERPTKDADVVPIHSASREAPAAKRAKGPAESRTAAKDRVAFTLRIDPDRHLRLRLASTVAGKSAQRLLTEALDSMLEHMDEVQSLAAKIQSRS